ncbi:MAG TPA: hypothetical protein VNZ52_16310 [Candidatus Thermoplasmatota archaeon]|nr:hypothetical protein [Candidatus Thermoplasmatota archaeon]
MSEAVSREAHKLRLVLDYLPCEPCLAVKVPDQELYCSLCRRLSRTVAQKVIVPVDVLVEAPAPAEPEPIIVPPPPLEGAAGAR